MDFDQRFDEQLFASQLGSLHERSVAKKRAADLRYTFFVLRLLWAAVVVPFFAGAACAYFLST